MCRFYRPEDVSQQQAYQADFWDVYASSEKVQVDVSAIVGKCTVSLEEQPGLHLPPPPPPPRKGSEQWVRFAVIQASIVCHPGIGIPFKVSHCSREEFGAIVSSVNELLIRA